MMSLVGGFLDKIPDLRPGLIWHLGIFGQGLIWHLGVITIVLAGCRALLPDENLAFDPQKRLSEVAQATLYLPKHWIEAYELEKAVAFGQLNPFDASLASTSTGSLALSSSSLYPAGSASATAVSARHPVEMEAGAITTQVYSEFTALFRYRVEMFLGELAGCFIAPCLLLFSMARPARVQAIVRFLHRNTVNRGPHGSFCSDACFLNEFGGEAFPPVPGTHLTKASAAPKAQLSATVFKAPSLQSPTLMNVSLNAPPTIPPVESEPPQQLIPSPAPDDSGLLWVPPSGQNQSQFAEWGSTSLAETRGRSDRQIAQPPPIYQSVSHVPQKIRIFCCVFGFFLFSSLASRASNPKSSELRRNATQNLVLASHRNMQNPPDTALPTATTSAPSSGAAVVRRAAPRRKIVVRQTLGEIGSEVFCVRFSPDGQYLAVGSGDGTVRIYIVQTGRLVHTMTDVSSSFPVSTIRWRPPGDRVKNVIVTGNAEGVVQHWHATQGKSLFRFVEEDNQILALDYRPDGTRFGTVGKDRKVRIYDDATKTHIQTLFGGDGTVTAGHSNRVFALKFHPTNPNCLITGGWDMTLQVWDLRVDHSVRSIYGPHICGDALDIHEDQILTGSWRTQDALQLWDFGSGRLLENIAWSRESIVNTDPACSTPLSSAATPGRVHSRWRQRCQPGASLRAVDIPSGRYGHSAQGSVLRRLLRGRNLVRRRGGRPECPDLRDQDGQVRWCDCVLSCGHRHFNCCFLIGA
ncbi:putative F-box and WD-40 domain protein 7 [Paratrimastix pyriformis]|uniref:Autophagy-related protein 9 n=1 Tax=Paratrimastix pyriformis TaxID=342808 RepID=A0ABQ8U9Q2_9EUKA|nr:putative F-box and WD-40 domain protein 7 [Paratrimastix pyriformis]